MKARDHIDWDDKFPGFGLRTRNGKKSWVFQYKFGDKHRRIKLGGPELSRDSARKLAQAEKGKLAAAKLGHGVDPATDRDRRKAETKPQPKARALGSMVPTYLDAREGAIKGSTREIQQRHLNLHWKALHDLSINNITRADVAGVLTAITNDRGPSAANRARGTLSKFYVWAIGEGICDHNPVVGTNKRPENDPRERSLSDQEAAAMWLAAPNNDYGCILKLLLLTGCRRDEIGSLKWSEVNIADRVITLPRERTKNGKEHIVPLTDAALAIVTDIERRDREYVFGKRNGGYQGWSKSKNELDAIIKLKDEWALHDLRRTVRTGLGKLGVQPHIAEAALNHLPPKLIRTYDRNTYANEKRAALDTWASHLMVAVAQATGANVTKITRPRPR